MIETLSLKKFKIKMMTKEMIMIFRNKNNKQNLKKIKNQNNKTENLKDINVRLLTH